MAEKQRNAADRPERKNNKRSVRHGISASGRARSRKLVGYAMKGEKLTIHAGKRAFRDGADRTNQRTVAAAKSKPKALFRQPKTELEQAIQRYVELFDFAPVGYITFDRVGRIEEVNFAAARLLGRSRRQLIGITFAVCIAKEDTQLFLDHLMKCRSSDDEAVTELSLKRIDGKKIPVLLSTTGTFGLIKDGARLYQTAIIDLTDRKRFEDTIQESEKRYRALFDLVPVAIYVCDADGNIREYNERAVELWGREPSLNGKQPKFCGSHKIYYPDGRSMPHEECPMARVLRGEKLTPNDLEIIIERPSGERRHVIPAPSIMTDVHGKITGAINCLFDITERQRAETAAMRLAAVVQSSHDAIAAKTLNGIVTDWNQSAQRIFGYKPEEIIGKSILTLIPKDRQSEEQAILRTVSRGESLDHYETIRQRKDGKLIDVSLTISPIKGPKGEILGVSKIARDITKQKQMTQRLAEQARLLDLTNDAVIVRDPQNRIVYWNRGAEEIYGFSAKEALGKITHELLQTAHPETYKSIQKQLQRDNRWSGELLHTRKDGKTITVSSRWSLDRDARGRPTSILETNTNVTARKRAEQQQQALYQFAQVQHSFPKVAEIYAAALDAILSALGCHRASILLFDKKNVMRFVAWRGLSERYRKAVEGHSPWKADAKNPKPVCINDVDIADIPKRLKSTIRSEGIRAATFIPLVSSQKLIGKFMTYYDAPHVFNDDELKLATTIATQLAQAIERRQAELALQQKEAELEQVVTQTPFMLTRCTRDLRYRYVSRAYAEMLGRKPEELAGKTIVEIIGEEALKTILPHIKKVLKGDNVEYEMEVPFQSAGVRWINCVYVPDQDSDGNIVGWFASLIDVGLRKQSEAVLQKSKELLEENVRERTRELDLANKELQSEIERRKGLESEILEISDREQQRLAQELHDGICQHLTAVAFMARSVGLRLKNHRVIEVKDIEKIAELVNNAATDTRNLSRALHRFDVDAAGLVEALEDLVDREMWRTPCRLEVNPSFHLDDDTVAAHLYRIAREAVINANKHAQAREIVLRLEKCQQEMVLRIIDDGVGLSDQLRPRQGLGFHIMNYRAELIGGRLEIDSSKHTGTRVSCYLPNHTPRLGKSRRKQNRQTQRRLAKR